MDHVCLSLHPSADTWAPPHFGGAAGKVDMQTHLLISVFNFLEYLPRSRIARWQGSWNRSFWRNLHSVYTVAAPFHIPSNARGRPDLPPSLSAFCDFLGLLAAALLMSVEGYPLRFWVVFPWWLVMLSRSRTLTGHLPIVFGEMATQVVYDLFHQDFASSLWSCTASLYVLDVNPILINVICNIFLHSVGWLFILLTFTLHLLINQKTPYVLKVIVLPKKP